MKITLTIQTIKEEGKPEYIGVFGSSMVPTPHSKDKETKVNFLMNGEQVKELTKIATDLFNQSSEMYQKEVTESLERSKKNIKSPYQPNKLKKS